MLLNPVKYSWNTRSYQLSNRSIAYRLHLDFMLLVGVFSLLLIGLLILYSASSENMAVVDSQLIRFGLAIVGMFVLAQIPPYKYRLWAPWIFMAGVGLLCIVLIMGHVGKGAQRWLSLGLFSFQPAEIIKLALPMILAWYFSEKPLPPTIKQLFVAIFLILVPTVLIAKQPDLGTAVLILASGACLLLLAGISWGVIGSFVLAIVATTPLIWHFMHSYQKERVLTFFNPERDPLGAGYHIIQSKIAIGSGGLFGKGWLNGTQSHLQFLPEHATDFIFAVCGEEFGLIGGIVLITLYMVVVGRCLYIASQAQDTFTRLLAGGLGLTFFISFFINMGMVVGILPVVGLPLPLISHGGTSIVTVLAGFGIIMSIHTHRKLLTR